MGDGVEDVVNMVAEVENWVGDDRLCGSNTSRQQGQSRRQRQGRLELLHCRLLQSEMREEDVDLLKLKIDFLFCFLH